MSVVPNKFVDRIAFYENHTAPWNTNAVAIGITVAAVTDLTTKTTAARAAYNAQQAAQEAARAATLNFQTAVDAMSIAGAALISLIRSKGKTGGPSIYALAEIPAPATPSPIPPPGQPFAFAVTLDATGALELKWKCPNPGSGVIYQIWRRIGGSGEFSYLGGAGTRSYVDSTVPAGSSQVTYQIQAVRSTAVGPWAQFNVNFGVTGGGGAMIASVEEAAPTKIAA